MNTTNRLSSIKYSILLKNKTLFLFCPFLSSYLRGKKKEMGGKKEEARNRFLCPSGICLNGCCGLLVIKLVVFTYQLSTFTPPALFASLALRSTFGIDKHFNKILYFIETKKPGLLTGLSCFCFVPNYNLEATILRVSANLVE